MRPKKKDRQKMQERDLKKALKGKSQNKKIKSKEREGKKEIKKKKKNEKVRGRK